MSQAGTVVVTGSAGGIGTALRRRLEKQGHRVIGVDRHEAEVVCDLSRDETRNELARRVAELHGGQLEGVVAAAGLLGMGGEAGSAGTDAAAAVSVNFFGAVATLAGLRGRLAPSSGAAVAIGSHMATTQPTSARIVEACLSGDEAAARDAAAAEPALAYASSKLALARWVRRQAPGPDWAGSGIRLNAVALGLVDTPMTASSVGFVLDHPEIMPIPMRRAATAEEAAALIAFLLSDQAGFFCGSVLYMDGGTDALTRTDDWPVALGPGA